MNSEYDPGNEEYQHKEKTAERYQVVIVGGGLSGIALARHLERAGVDYCILDSEPLAKSQSVHYLTTKQAAQSLGLQSEYENQVHTRIPITGYTRFDAREDGLQVLEALSPDSSRSGGFVTVSKQQIKDRAASDGISLLGSNPVIAATQRPDTVDWELTLRNGKTTSAEIIIDATGVRTRVARLAGLVDREMLDNRKVRYCYGAVLEYLGPEDRLFFADRFPEQADLGIREGAGWIMPLGNKTAEVVVGWEDRLGEVGKWQIGHPRTLLRRYCDWFAERGIMVNFNQRLEVVSGIFSQQPLDYRALEHNSNLILFGESLGLNQPLNGYLIGDIDGYARILCEEIVNRLNGRTWRPYEAIYADHTLFGPQVVLSERKTRSVLSGVGRSAATADLQKLLVACLSPDGLWRAIDSGVPIKQILIGVVSNPKYLPVIARMGVEYLSLMLRDDLYQREVWLKIKKRLANKNKDK